MSKDEREITRQSNRAVMMQLVSREHCRNTVERCDRFTLCDRSVFHPDSGCLRETEHTENIGYEEHPSVTDFREFWFRNGENEPHHCWGSRLINSLGNRQSLCSKLREFFRMTTIKTVSLCHHLKYKVTIKQRFTSSTYQHCCDHNMLARRILYDAVSYTCNHRITEQLGPHGRYDRLVCVLGVSSSGKHNWCWASFSISWTS